MAEFAAVQTSKVSKGPRILVEVEPNKVDIVRLLEVQ